MPFAEQGNGARLAGRLRSFGSTLVRLSRCVLRWVVSDRAAFVMFCCSLCIFAFAFGLVVGRYHVFPYQHIRAAEKTARSLTWRLTGSPDYNAIGFSHVPVKDIARGRIVSLTRETGGEAFLFTGGWNAFLEYCPEHGCVAAVLDRQGGLVHAYTLRPEEFARRIIYNSPHEMVRTAQGLSPSDDIFGVAQLPDGGLIVTIFNNDDFPTGEGVARLDRDGHVLWYRRSHGHHWPYFDGRNIIVATSRIREGDIQIDVGPSHKVTLRCGAPSLDDGIAVLSLDGVRLTEFSVFEAIVRSPYRGVMMQINKEAQEGACDPLHLNYVRPVGAELASHLKDVSADDIIVSLRTINAFAIIGAKSHGVKHLYTGSFRRQHSVQPFVGSRVLIFDDQGVNDGHPPSRVLDYDLLTGGEHVVMSGATAGAAFFTLVEGELNLSRDRKRLLVSVADQGEAYELRLSDGAILTRLRNLQDLRRVDSTSIARNLWAARRRVHGIYYVEQQK